ncbi:Uncharacterized protein R10E11.6 [Toxocara canis]|uniref:Uncharacterized protein R10E11.6 n=1 Tax=Toxocara canis TaxID=6265 RepID=A0A0B2VUL7_TOXCA|nr:Uncharacterized protein R10E11.6 [Toxocara canis]
MQASGAEPHADGGGHLSSSANAAVNMIQQMHFNANIPIPSQNGTGLLHQGGGIVPPALLEETRVPRFYQEAIASCGALSASQLPNTALVYNLMVTSRLPRPVLGNIWSLVNRTLPGQLTRQEFFSCLALIALAQRGQSLSALSNVTVLPIPHFQACAAFPNQQYVHGQPADHHIAVVCPSTVPPTFTRTMPVQMGVPFPNKKPAPSNVSASQQNSFGFNALNSGVATSTQIPHSLTNPGVSGFSSPRSSQLSTPTVTTAAPLSAIPANRAANHHQLTSEAVSVHQVSHSPLHPLPPAAALSKSQIPHSMTSPAFSQTLFQSLPVSAASGPQMPGSLTMPVISSAYTRNMSTASVTLAAQNLARSAAIAGGEFNPKGCSLQPSVSSFTGNTKHLPPFMPSALLSQSLPKVNTPSGEGSLSAVMNFANFENSSSATVQTMKQSNVPQSPSSCEVPNIYLGNGTQMCPSSVTSVPVSLSDNASNTLSHTQPFTAQPDNSSFSLFDSLTTHPRTVTAAPTYRNDLDILCDISFGHSSDGTADTNSLDSGAKATSAANSVAEQFGDFASSKHAYTAALSGAQLLTPRPIAPIPFGSEPVAKGKEEITDIYAAMKAVEGDLNGTQSERECVRVWERCIAEAHRLLKDADIALPPFSEEAVKAVAHTERGARYLSALEAVFEMVSRIRKGRSEDVKKMNSELREIDEVWARLSKYVDHSTDEHQSSLSINGLLSKRCGICVSEISDDTLLEFAGTAYHKQCANLWINRVDSLLPKLS